jgi:6-phosphofructokinase 1
MNAVIAHGGGPTAVLNASLVGLYKEWSRRSRGGKLFAARFGVRGILEGNFVELTGIPEARLREAARTPGSMIGSSRLPLTAGDIEKIGRVFRERGIDCFFYTGGNGSMETALRISRAVPGLQVIGIPKTIDNDLAVTHHTPGYPSAARFFIQAVRDIGLDNRALPSPICIVEVLGRNTGWIAAATALARARRDDAPHLIYFPERRLSLDRIATDVETVYRRLGRVVIAVCEGQIDDRGQPFGADVDRAGSDVHRLASNLGHTLAAALTRKLGIRARAEKPGLLGRSCSALSSGIDRRHSMACGHAAAKAALHGESGKMITLTPEGTGLTEFENVARIERPVPDAWIAAGSNDVGESFREFLTPLVGRIDLPPSFEIW